MTIRKILIVIPAYNEEDNITTVINELRDEYPSYDYVIVNDGSLDRTSRICKENGFNLISLPINLGLSGAFQTGMKFAYRNGYDAALQFDADGQHDPAYIGAMVERMEQTDADIVIGSRFVEDKKTFGMRAAGNSVISAFVYLTTHKKILDSTSGMRLYSRRLMGLYAKYMNFEPEPDTIAYLIRCGAKVEEIQVNMRKRMAGHSQLDLQVHGPCLLVHPVHAVVPGEREAVKRRYLQVISRHRLQSTCFRTPDSEE